LMTGKREPRDCMNDRAGMSSRTSVGAPCETKSVGNRVPLMVSCIDLESGTRKNVACLYGTGRINRILVLVHRDIEIDVLARCLERDPVRHAASFEVAEFHRLYACRHHDAVVCVV